MFETAITRTCKLYYMYVTLLRIYICLHMNMNNKVNMTVMMMQTALGVLTLFSQINLDSRFLEQLWYFSNLLNMFSVH